MRVLFSVSWISLYEHLLWDHVFGLEGVKGGSWEISRATSPESHPQATQTMLTLHEFPVLTIGRTRTSVVPGAVMKSPEVEERQVASTITKMETT